METTNNLIIIGSGPAGLTAAIYAARARLNPLVLEGKTPGGQLVTTSYVENWPGDMRVLGPELMRRMRDHAAHYGATLSDQEAIAINVKKSPFTVTTHRQETFSAKALIIATGAEPKRLNCPGENDYWSKGVSTCAVCDGAFFKDKKVVIVGGGDTAMENALFMTNFTNHITIIHILDKLTACASMQTQLLSSPAIKIIYNSTVSKINGNGTTVTSVTVTNQKTKEVHDRETDGVFVAIGLNPKTELFKGQLELNQYGYLAVTDHTKTSIPGVFAAGDVADFRYRQAITAAGSGCMAALDAEKYISSLSK